MLVLAIEKPPLSALAEAYDRHSSWMPFLNVEPKFEPLKEHVRFQELVRKMRLDRPQDRP